MSSRRIGPEGTLAIISGRDALPRLIAEYRRSVGLPYLVISFAGAAESWTHEHPHQVHQFEKAGRLFTALRQAGCTHVVFAGAMNRPRLKPWRADGKAVVLIGKVMALLAKGDNELLSGLAGIFEDEGFSVVGAGDCLEGLTAGSEILGQVKPIAEDCLDATQGVAILSALGPLDVGQAVVIGGGVCLGIEAIEGTDALLARVAALPNERQLDGSAAVGIPGGVLVKMPKPGQDRRVDLPSIGPRTIDGVARARLRGIVIEAGGANILERAETVRLADQAGLFLWSASAADLAK